MVTGGRWLFVVRKREVARNSCKESKARAMDAINELVDRVVDDMPCFGPSSLRLRALSGSCSMAMRSHGNGSTVALLTEALDSEDATETSGEEVALFA
jgi:hypothetical protein